MKTCKKIWSVHGMDASWNVQLCSTSQITSFSDSFSSTYKDSALEVLNDYALCKSTHSLTHSLTHNSLRVIMMPSESTSRQIAVMFQKKNAFSRRGHDRQRGALLYPLRPPWEIVLTPDVQICRQARVNLTPCLMLLTRSAVERLPISSSSVDMWELLLSHIYHRVGDAWPVWRQTVTFWYGWRRGVVVSGVRRMNKVYVRWAWLVLGWVTVFGRVYHLGM